MKNCIKIIIRILFLILILLIILAIANLLLKIKSQKNNSNQFTYFDNDYLLFQNNEKTKLNMYQMTMDDMTFELLDDEIQEKDSNKKRILFVGDSFLWGPINNNVNTLFWKKLQRLFEENGYNDIEILAAGNCGMGSYDEIKYILANEEYMNKIKPDLVILCFLDNDWDILDDQNEFFIPRFTFDYFVDEYYGSGIWSLIKKFYPYLYDWYINSKVTKMTGDKDYNIKYGDKYGYFFYDILELDEQGIVNKNEWFDNYENNVVKKLTELNYPFVIFNEIFPFSVPWAQEFRGKALKLFDEYGLEVINPISEYEDLEKIYGPDALCNNKDDWHPSEILNNFYADQLYEYLIKNYKDVVGEKSFIRKFDIEINDHYPYKNLNLKKEVNNKYSFNWPNDEDMPYYWTKTRNVKLNLKYPLRISELKLNGKFKNGRIWINFENGQNEYIELVNDNNVFKITDKQKVASINIHVDADVGTNIELEIIK